MYKTNGLPSHTCTVLRECCKDDDESLWKSLKFDPSPRKNALADRPRNLQRRLGPGCLPSAKFCPDRTRVFFIPIRMKYHYSGSAIISFWFFLSSTAEAPTPTFTQNASEDAVLRNDVLLGFGKKIKRLGSHFREKLPFLRPVLARQQIFGQKPLDNGDAHV